MHGSAVPEMHLCMCWYKYRDACEILRYKEQYYEMYVCIYRYVYFYVFRHTSISMYACIYLLLLHIHCYLIIIIYIFFHASTRKQKKYISVHVWLLSFPCCWTNLILQYRCIPTVWQLVPCFVSFVYVNNLCSHPDLGVRFDFIWAAKHSARCSFLFSSGQISRYLKFKVPTPSTVLILFYFCQLVED